MILLDINPVTVTTAGEILLNYGVLGVIAVAYFGLFWWVLKTTREEKESLIKLLSDKEVINNDNIREFHKAVIEQTQAVRDLTMFLRTGLNKITN